MAAYQHVVRVCGTPCTAFILRILSQLQDQADTASDVSSGKYILCVQGEPGGNVNIMGADSVGH
jgi:hypothetical protein